MLHVGLDVIQHKASSDAVATLKCRMALRPGRKRPTDAMLDRSRAMAAANAVIDSWTDDRGDGTRPPRAGGRRMEFGAVTR